MTGGIQMAQWRVMGSSVRGVSHRRRNQLNQDAIEWDEVEGGIAVAVADGHGSASCFRSATGARLAVRACIEVLRELPVSEVSEDAVRSAPLELVERWRAAVAEHARANPFTEPELAFLNGRAADPPWVIYGTTILAARVTGSHIVYLQLGDGDILIVDESGGVTRPWPRDERFLGVETASLCGASPEEDARVLVRDLIGESPSLVLLATDGYANSFREDEGFLRTGSDVLAILRREGHDYVDRHLESWLAETSEQGSGDDITAAVLTRVCAGGPVDG
jgi:serine/threonine protein phosphatase PrpC